MFTTLSLRMPVQLYEAVTRQARQNERSLNAEIVYRLKRAYQLADETESPDSATADSPAPNAATVRAARPADAD